MHLTHRKTCRACGSSALTPVIDLGPQHLQGSFVKPGKEDPPTRRIPTSLVRCNPERDERACGLLQMEYTVPPEVLYSAYWYRSGTNETMRSHLRGIARQIVPLLEGCPTPRMLDIGCNDGTLLACFPSTFLRFGIDPSDIVVENAAELTIVRDLFPSRELTRLTEGCPFDLITSIAMFYDLEDPIAFARAISDVLAPNGVWVFEMSYMPSMLEMTSYDTICHEHLEYYSLATVEFILRRSGLRVFNAELNPINGGSIRCFATHEENLGFRRQEFRVNIASLRQHEFDLELDTDLPYKHFQDRVNVHRESLNSLLRKLKKDNKRIHVYGASTKGNTILQWCGIDHRIIEVAAERNPDKYGAHTLGTDIPIVSEEESRAMNPDYYLVLPWHFREEFLSREREMLQRGVGLVFPLPAVEIVRG